MPTACVYFAYKTRSSFADRESSGPDRVVNEMSDCRDALINCPLIVSTRSRFNLIAISALPRFQPSPFPAPLSPDSLRTLMCSPMDTRENSMVN